MNLKTVSMLSLYLFCYFYLFQTFISNYRITNAKAEQAFIRKSWGKKRLFYGMVVIN
jgi:hypothetical protein